MRKSQVFTVRSMALCALAAISFCYSSQAKGDLTFSTTFTAQAQSDLNAAQQDLFIQGVQFWDDIIIDHQDLNSRNWDLSVNTFSQASSGGGVLLGSAGPGSLAFSDVVAGAPTSDGRFIISTSGSASFNVHPDAGVLSFDTIVHEIGHALGIGTLWEDNEVYNDGNAATGNRTGSGSPGEYLGAHALLAFQNEFVGQSAAAFIPVELGGGAGTAHGHWNESDDFGQTLTGLVTFSGQDMRDELMTGWASPGADFLSNMSRESLRDIGYNIVPLAVPEPGSAFIIAMCSVGFLVRRRK